MVFSLGCASSMKHKAFSAPWMPDLNAPITFHSILESGNFNIYFQLIHAKSTLCFVNGRIQMYVSHIPGSNKIRV